MECRTVQEMILEALDEGTSNVSNSVLEVHLATCSVCAAFLAKQRAVDQQLSMCFVPPELDPAFRSRLRRRIAQEKTAPWWDALPDMIHFATLAAGTLLCASLLPIEPSATMGAGGVLAVLSYVALAALRSAFDDDQLNSF